MIAANDAIILVMMLVGYVPIIISSGRREFTRWFYFAYTALFVGVVARVMGAFYQPELMILVERGVGLALAGVFALIGAYVHFRKIQSLQWNIDKPAAKTEHLAQLNTALAGKASQKDKKETKEKKKK